MKRLLLLIFLFFAARIFAQTISLNPSFGVKGFASLANKLPGLDLRLESAALQPDGKIIAVGSIVKSTTGANRADFLVARLNKNGSLDNAFGDNGMMMIDFSGYADAAKCVALTIEGKIVVAGSAQDQNGEAALALIQLNSNGSLNAGFGKSGKVAVNLSEPSEATSIAVQKDGKIVVGGYIYTNNSDFLLLRFKQDGTPDKSFGKKGIVTQDFNQGSDMVASIAIQKDGKILAGGEGNLTFPLVRYNANGQQDRGFGRGGEVVVNKKKNPAFSTRYIRGISIQNDGKIVVGGEFGKLVRKTFGVARINDNGTVDNSFGNEGMVTTDFGFYAAGVNSIALQSNGKIIAGGMVRKTANPPNQYGVSNDDWDFAMARFDLGGKPDASFGNEGKLVTDYVSFPYAVSNNFITKLLLQNDQLLAVGMSISYENQWGDPVKGSVASYQLKTTCTGNMNIDVMSFGLKPYTVYLGYKPATVLFLKAKAYYDAKPASKNTFSYYWSAGPNLEIAPQTVRKQEIQVTATGTGNYESKVKLTVIDESGCSSEKEYKIQVIDARCGRNKVLVCKEKNSKRSTVCVSQKEASVLLAKGGSLGNCH